MTIRRQVSRFTLSHKDIFTITFAFQKLKKGLAYQSYQSMSRVQNSYYTRQKVYLLFRVRGRIAPCSLKYF